MMLLRYLPNANGEIPLTAATGQIADVLKFMHFHFWQEVFVESHDKHCNEQHARWIYPAENIGDELTYMVLLTDTEQLVARSNVRPATDPLFPNFREHPDGPRPTSTNSTPLDEPMSATSGEKKKNKTTIPLWNVSMDTMMK